MAWRRFVTGMGFSRVNAATCASAWTPASVRPEPATCTGLPFDSGDDLFQRALNRGQSGLHLPAVEIGAVVSQRDPDAAHQAGREPGFTTGIPCSHSGHSAG